MNFKRTLAVRRIPVITSAENVEKMDILLGIVLCPTGNYTTHCPYAALSGVGDCDLYDFLFCLIKIDIFTKWPIRQFMEASCFPMAIGAWAQRAIQWNFWFFSFLTVINCRAYFKTRHVFRICNFALKHVKIFEIVDFRSLKKPNWFTVKPTRFP